MTQMTQHSTWDGIYSVSNRTLCLHNLSHAVTGEYSTCKDLGTVALGQSEFRTLDKGVQTT